MSNGTYGLPYDKPLTKVAQAYKRQRYIADLMLPTVVANTMDGVWNKKSLGISEADSQAGGDNKFKHVDLQEMESTNFSINENGLSTTINRRVQEKFNNYNNPRFSAQKWAVESLTDILKTNLEKQVFDSLGDAAKYAVGNKVTLTNEWDDYANSDPVTDVLKGINAIEDGTTTVADTLICGMKTFRFLSKHPEVRGSVVYNGAKDTPALNQEQLAIALGVKRIVVVPAKYKDATGAIAKFLEDKAIVAALPMTESEIDDGTLACLVRHVQDTPYSVFVKAKELPQTFDQVFVSNHFQYKELNFAGGYLISNTVS